MSEPISRDIAELREWLVRIDTKVDYLNDVKHTAEEADAKADRALALANENREDIRDMKANTKWVWGAILTVIGFLVTVGIAVFK
jgi:hypothetical protein